MKATQAIFPGLFALLFAVSCSNVDFSTFASARTNPNDPNRVSSPAPVSSISSVSQSSSYNSSMSNMPSYSGDIIEIYVRTLNRGNAAQLEHPAEGYNNVVRIAGDFNNFIRLNPPHSNTLMSSWNAVVLSAEMEPMGGNVWRIVLSNTLSSNQTLFFGLLNGTPGYPGTWELQETGVHPYKGIHENLLPSRSVNCLANARNSFWLTNDGEITNNTNNIPHPPIGIANWGYIGPTYTVSNILQFVFTNYPGIVYRSTGNSAMPATNVDLFGSLNSWGIPLTSAVAGSYPQNLVFPVFNYQGCASFKFQLRTMDNVGFTIFGGRGTNNSEDWYHSLKLSQNGQTVVITNPGPYFWRGTNP